jgi:hypothetical protein
MIGLYNLDLTVAWTEKDKLLAHKWFALIDPDEPQEGMTVRTLEGKISVTSSIVNSKSCVSL